MRKAKSLVTGAGCAGPTCKLGDLPERYEEVLGWTDRNLHHWITQLADVPGPDTGTVDEVFTLDDPASCLHTVHADVEAGFGSELVARLGEDPGQSAVAHKPGTAAICQVS